MGCLCSSESSTTIATEPPNNNNNNNSNDDINKTRTQSFSKKDGMEEFWSSLEPNYEIGNILKDVPIFARVSEYKRNKLAGAMTTETFKKSDIIFKQGDKGDKFYIISEGTASVIVTMPNTKRERVVAKLKKGDYFGETALLSNSPRNATIEAISDEDLKCLTLDSETFCRLFIDLKLKLARRKGIMEETGMDGNDNNNENNDDNEILNKDKTTEEIELITKSLHNSVLFEQLDNDQIKLIALAMGKKKYKKNDILIEKNKVCNNLFIINTGVITHLTTKPMIENGKVINQIIRKSLTFGSVIGELNLLYNSNYDDTYVVDIDAELFIISRKEYRKILKTSSNEKFAEYNEFLNKIPLFDCLITEERRRVAEALTEIHFDKEHVIMKQGNDGDSFYIIRHGTAVVHKMEKGLDNPKEICQLGPGNYFGERALIKNDVRAATVTALTDLDCLYLDREGFTILLGPLGDILENRINKDYDGKQQNSNDNNDDNNINNNENETNMKVDISINNLEIIGILGKGSFGVVQLMKLKELIPNNTHIKYVALKIVHKPNVVALNQQEHILNEKKVLMELNKPILGGELFSYLRDLNTFEEEQSKFYAACVIEAFDHIHSKNIIYRDLKPENLLINHDGYLKITDFGFAKFVYSRTFTLCGTPDYLAPEVISGTGHNKAFDWWTLGILIYEMIESLPPFYNENPMQTYAKIMHGSIKFSNKFNKTLINLIKQLLQPKPTKRLGALKSGTNGVRNHDWFKGFDWNKLKLGQIKAPIIPDIKSMEDLSNFDDYSENDRSEDPDFDSDQFSWDQNF